VKYDDLDYHLGGKFPEGFPEEHGWTHIGVFLIWLIEHDLHSNAWTADDPAFGELVRRIPARTMEPSDLIDVCDGVLVDEMLSGRGNAFARACYDDYLELFGAVMLDHVERGPFWRRFIRSDVDSYHADPGWRTYDVMAPHIAALYAGWEAGAAPPADWQRNYAAMGDDKLLTCVSELARGEGDAYERCLAKGGEPEEHRRRAEAVAREHGLL
jgi:hypothetical protein